MNDATCPRLMLSIDDDGLPEDLQQHQPSVSLARHECVYRTGVKSCDVCHKTASRDCWAEVVPLKNMEATNVAEGLVGIFCRLCIPKDVLSDSGTQFTLSMMDDTFRLVYLKGLRTIPQRPTCNRLWERFTSTLKKILKRLAADQPKE